MKGHSCDLMTLHAPTYRNEGEERLEALHHPFTAPNPADVEGAKGGEGDLRTARALAYDLVLNGTEIGGEGPLLA